MGGGGRRWANGPLKNVVSEELHVVQQFRALDIPHSAIYAESGNADPKLYAGLAGLNLHVLAWVYASMKLDRMRDLLPGVPDRDLPVVRHRDGSMAFRLDDGAAIVDYTHPRAPELLQRFWASRFQLGLAGSMVDFGDVVPDDAVFFNGKTGTEMHNFYAHSYHRAYHDAFYAARGEDYVLFARSGCAGDQASICYFAGDHQANFFGMRGALRGGLSAAACGLSTWGADAGGYTGWPDPEVYIRWTQWAAFCPLMRFHGTTPREPWEFGDAAVAIYRRYAWLRESLLPYITATAQTAHDTGTSIMRSMMFAYPDSKLLRGCDDQYMFGADLLIAPVLGPGDERDVLLPPGTWTDFWTGREFRGDRMIALATPLDRIGVLLREGAAIPIDLPTSLTPGDSMSAGRTRAVLATRPHQGTPWRVDTRGADVLLRFVHGARVVSKVNGRDEWNEGDAATQDRVLNP
jgi:alpha-glucosidase (family GH31 glycosyl hydrolase)